MYIKHSSLPRNRYIIDFIFDNKCDKIKKKKFTKNAYTYLHSCVPCVEFSFENLSHDRNEFFSYMIDEIY